MIKALIAAATILMLTACTPATPTEAQAIATRKGKLYSQYVKSNGYDVCIRGNKYLYLEAGNTSQAIPIFGADGRPIQCNEGDFQ